MVLFITYYDWDGEVFQLIREEVHENVDEIRFMSEVVSKTTLFAHGLEAFQ